jgi:hypothetical protein
MIHLLVEAGPAPFGTVSTLCICIVVQHFVNLHTAIIVFSDPPATRHNEEEFLTTEELKPERQRGKA